MNSPLVSIASISYNQERFIAQAIDSWLMQQCDFNFEIVIGEDCSTDNTLKIIKEYQARIPNLIKVITSESNVGMMSNFMRTLKACKGKYIAICEADDFWTNKLKLQKQVDVLKACPKSMMCFHNAEYKYESSSKPNMVFHEKKMKDTYLMQDLLKQWLIPTASVVFKNVIPKEFPVFFNTATHGDLALFMYLAQFGDIKYIPDSMSVYRLNDGGITNKFKGIEHNLTHIEQCIAMKVYFKPKYNYLFNIRISKYYLSTARYSARINHRKKAFKYFSKAFGACKLSLFINFKEYSKFLYEILFKVKDE
jgi:glycosyltransferase involved in cell wall biosynthesis